MAKDKSIKKYSFCKYCGQSVNVSKEDKEKAIELFILGHSTREISKMLNGWGKRYKGSLQDLADDLIDKCGGEIIGEL